MATFTLRFKTPPAKNQGSYELAQPSFGRLISGCGPLKGIVNARNFFKNIINCDCLHAKIVAADRLPVVVGVHARAAGYAGPQGDRVWLSRGKQRGCLRPKQSNDVNRRHRGEMSRATVIRHQNLTAGVKHEDLTQSRFAGKRDDAA